MPWKFMLVDIFNVPSSLCFEEGGGLARGYRHIFERDCRGASVKGRSWSTRRRKMCPSPKTRLISTAEFQAKSVGDSRSHPRR